MFNKKMIPVDMHNGYVTRSSLITNLKTANSLLVIFPGDNYSCKNPLLYFAHKIALTYYYDVLVLSDNFTKLYNFNKTDAILTEIKERVKAESGKSYENLIFISKDEGTFLAAMITKYFLKKNIKNIFLSPTNKAVPYILGSDSKIIIGENDTDISPECLSVLTKKKTEDIIWIKDVDHNLEYDNDIFKSIELLKGVVSIYRRFFESTKAPIH